MTMNSSGPISLGGSTAGESINLENGFSATAQVSLNDTAVRNLAGVASGAITMPTNFYGKSNRVSISYTFSANTANASLNVTSISGYSAGKSDITITVNSGIYLYSTSTGNAGLTLTGGSSGDTITLVNNGYIMGMGGHGQDANYPGNTGNFPNLTAGGNAISLGFNTTINNTNASAYIGGGGGGGGAGGGYSYDVSSGGGGGAGGGVGGQAYNGGNTSTGGSGGSVGSSGSNASNPNYYGVAGGGGGGRIFPGTGGTSSSSSTAGPSTVGKGGGSGGSGGASMWDFGCSVYQPAAGGGGGGWGASGGTGYATGQAGEVSKTAVSGAGGSGSSNGGNASVFNSGNPRSGAAGGKAVALNGYSVTWTSGNTTRVYGAIS